MKPNASELCGQSGAWGSSGVVRGDVSGPPAAEPGATGEPTGSIRGQTIRLKSQHKGAGQGAESRCREWKGTWDTSGNKTNSQTGGSITLPNILLTHSVCILSSRATHG